ncbi:MAG: transglycosylase SLT domain-containing protein [Pseudomonadota bacterium]
MIRAFALAFILCVLAAPPALAAGADDDFLAAREAFRLGSRDKLDAVAPKLRDHVLYPYVEYYRLRLSMAQATPAEVRAFLARHQGTVLEEQARADWLRILGEASEWPQFREEYARYQGDAMDIRCYALQAAMLKEGYAALKDARPIWFTAREMPDACVTVFEGMVSGGILTRDDIWARVRLALSAGKTSLAGAVGAYLPKSEAITDKALKAAARNPESHVKTLGRKTTRRAEREVTLYALQRLARVNPEHAAGYWAKLEPAFPEADRRFAWQRLAYYAALYHQPQALEWYAKAGDLAGDDDALEWKARAALRGENWGAVLAAIDAMSPARQKDPAWRYWKARALKAQGEAGEVPLMLVELSREHHFYGQLATDALGSIAAAPEVDFQPGAAEVAAIAREPGIQRALKLFDLALRWEGIREWNYTVRDFDDRRLLAAAELARRHQLWDRAIFTAERTRELHDFRLRYLAPYREQLQAAARDMALDDAWVLGLIRQESRFMVDARSSAGASGLMQLMPGTARWVAKKMGMTSYRSSMVNEVETNLALGTYYLKHVHDRLDGSPVLASAAYNAGPRRAQRWRDERPLEGAIYAETIPFNETRDYVKKVMSNAEYYAGILGRPWGSITTRLGTVPAKPRDDKVESDEP